LPVDDGLDGLTAVDNDAHIALACLLRGEPKEKVSRVVDKLRARKRRRAIVFWSAIEAIVGKEPRAFALKLKELYDLYQESAANRGAFPGAHVDGSILWHLARRSGIARPELAEPCLDLILR
jgi:hypothetical protein